ncbi:MAG: alpha/beta fold hydrolase, partial [Syntrophales bacterium]
VLTLALLDAGGAPSPKKSELVMRLEKGNNPLVGNNVEDFDKLIALVFVKTPTIPASFKKIMVADWIAHAEFNKKIWNDVRSASPVSLEPILPLIQAPVLIIWGDQDKVLDVGGVAFLEKYLKNYRTVIIKDVGHCPMIEQPEETAKVYMSFLKEKR